MSDAGHTKQTLYEVGRDNLPWSTCDRAMDALDAVNSEIETLSNTRGVRVMGVLKPTDARRLASDSELPTEAKIEVRKKQER